MPYEINQIQFEKVRSLPAKRRYEHFIKRVADSCAVWTLRAQDGPLLFGGKNDRAYIPVWPYPVYARYMAMFRWNGCYPEEIDLDDFLLKWIAAAERQGRAFAVFPSDDGRGAVTSPAQLLWDISRELEWYE